MYKQRKTGKIVLTLFIILIVLGAGAGAYYFFFMNSTERPTKVTISLELNGGAFSETPYGYVEENGIFSKSFKIGEAYGYVPEPTKSGYAFVGWSLTGVEPCIESVDIVESERPFTLYAVWEVERIYTYKVYYAIYDVDTGAIYSTKLKTPQTFTAYNRATICPEILQFDGYTFFDGTTKDGKSSDVATKLVADNMNLFIYYVANTYKIKYAYSGVGATSDIVTTFKYSTDVVNLAQLRSIADIQSSDARFIVNGMTFSHWCVNGKTFGDETFITRANLADMGFALNLSNGGVDEITLDALYKETTYTLTFMSQGSVVGTDEVKFNALLTQPTDPDALGYTFVGWYAQEIGATGTQISQFTPIDFAVFRMPSNDCILYAGFTLINYTLTLELGDDGYYEQGTEPPTQYNIESDFVLSCPNTTRVGYEFKGWTGSGLTETTLNLRIYNMAGDRTYTAVFGEKTYKIKYNMNDGKIAGVIQNPTEYTISTPDITLLKPAKRGYDFVGWRLTGETDVNLTTVINQGSTGDREYTAVFTPISYNIFYDNIISAEFDIEKTTFTVEDSPYTIASPTRKGYAFQGWEYNGEVLENSTISFAGIYENITLFATWGLQTYTITYELNGGSYAEGYSNPTEFTIETETITLCNPTKANYTFAGWTGTLYDARETTGYIRQGEVFENLTFVANYTPINYQITYENLENCTFGESSTNPNPTEYTVEQTFTLVNPEKRGYDFAGWTYTYNETTQTNKTMKIETGAFSGDLTFSATFTAKKYTITLDTKDGSISTPDRQALINAGIEVISSSKLYYTIENENFTLPQPTLSGNSFTGWRNIETQEVDVETVIYTNETVDLAFEALWNAKVYNIEYELNGGQEPEGITYPKTYSYNSPDVSPETPLRAGYTFVGWTLYKLLDDGTTWQELQDITSINCKKSTGDRKFKASWNVNNNTKYTIEYRLQPINGSTEKSEYALYRNESIIERTTTDKSVTKEAIDITGFTAEESSITQNINGDGSTKFVFYYSRNQQRISASADGAGIESVIVSNNYGSSGNGNYYYEQDITITVTLKKGYIIGGIYENGTTVSETVTYTFKVGQIDREFTAKAKIVRYYITYYGLDGATFSGSTTNPNRGTYTVTDTFTLVNPELSGKHFQGWSEENYIDVNAKQTTVTIENMATDLWFTAHFGEIEYVIDYDLKGGQKADGGSYPLRYTSSSDSISPTTPVYLGYTFTGWTVFDENASEISGATTIPKGSCGYRKFVANWTPNSNTPYVVKHYYMTTSGDFDASPETENLTGTTGAEVTPATKPQTGFETPATQTREISGDGTTEIEYYYYRVAYTVTITQVGDGIDTITPIATQYWGTIVSIDVVLKRGYYLKEWTQTSGATAVINDDNKQSTKLEFTMPTENIGLTIETALIEYKIEYTPNVGTLADGINPTTYTILTSNFTLNDPAITGFDFEGWISQDISTPTKGVIVDTSLCKDLHFYAVFNAEKVNYTIEYHYMSLDGTTYNLGNTVIKQELADETITVTPNKAYEKVGFTTPQAQTVTIKPNGSTVVKFEYVRNKYTITISENETNSGIATLSGAGEYYFGATVPFVATLKEFYQFKGWLKDGNTINDQLSFDYEFTDAKDVTFIASTRGNIYSITYDYGMASADPIDNKNNPIEYEYGVGATIVSPTSANYAFLGWQGVGVSNTLYSKLAIGADSNENVTLKMHWGKYDNSLSYMTKNDDEGGYASAGRSPGYKMSQTVEIPDYVKLTAKNIRSISYGGKAYIYSYYSAVVVGEDYYNLFDTPQENGIYKVKEIYGEYYIESGLYLSNFMTFENCDITEVKLGKFVEKIGDYAFQNTKVTTFTASDNLKTLGDGVFYQCNRLNSVNLNNIQTIGKLAFYKCSNLQTIDFGEVETIGDKAFMRCNSLQSIDLKNVKTLGDASFYECKNIETISNAKTLSSIGTDAFAYNENLKTVDFNDSQLTELGDSAFYGCFRLENVKLPSGLTKINNATFYMCKSLREISIPNNVTYIGDYAFSFCGKLRKTGLDANSKLQTICSNAFQSCVSLIEVTMPSTLATVGSAFRNCSKLYQITNLTSFSDTAIINALFGNATNSLASASKTGTFDNGVLVEDTAKKIYTLTKDGETILVDYYGTDRDVDLSGANFTRVYRYAFYDLANMQTAVLPSSLEKLGVYAFYKCRNLLKVKWLANIETLDYSTDSTTGYNVKMFEECVKLVQLDMPSCFSDSANWVNFVDKINVGLEIITHGGTFKNTWTTTNGITTYKITSGDDAGTYFIGYSGNATTLDLSGYSKIYAGALYGCNTLQTVTLPSALTAIPESLFGECWDLTSVELPDSVASIGNYAFEECFNLPTLDIPTNVSTIGKYAFSDCIRLDDIVIPENVTIIEEKTFSGCFGLKKCKLSSKVTSIGKYAFQTCTLDYKDESGDYYFVLPSDCTIAKNAFKESREDLATLYGED